MTKRKSTVGASTRGLGAGWQQRLPFRDAQRGSPERTRAAGAIRALRHRGLPSHCIVRLEQALEVQVASYSIVEKWPTIAEDREAILQVADLCEQLAQSLDALPPRAAVEVGTAALRVFRDPLATDKAREPLRAFVAACRARAAGLPAQSRRESYPGVIRCVHAIVGPLGIQPSPREGTRFHDICRAAFVLADLRGRQAKVSGKNPRITTVDPTASIRAYMDGMKGAEKAGSVIS